MPEPERKKQNRLAFEPETEDYAGVKHEWSGTLYVPTPEETTRIEAEAAERDVSPVILAEQLLYVRHDGPRTKVKMKMKDALRFRQRGA
jgi:hypothetical protein